MASVGGNVSLNVPGKIQRLEEAVVNRIAAGEVTTLQPHAGMLFACIVLLLMLILNFSPLPVQVVQRPANAIKEMIENWY